ncbi:hypothetical protein [Xenorhabdus lircayensis]|uniref:Arc-like DNA binding domain-containing protein n=1 Tax=Xenorhabdus lircayensis TaxID=2763499 RepID=A0ABS0U3W7_9GAMM|nr:hypothetical protein [Xenorhabdus lircayensis]MBI6548581.1 hypothetical protein [Xenorhabdus lircayensis]
MTKEKKTSNPIQLRLPPESEKWILKAAEKSLRTRHSEIVYRLMLPEEMEKKGEIEIK